MLHAVSPALSTPDSATASFPAASSPAARARPDGARTIAVDQAIVRLSGLLEPWRERARAAVHGQLDPHTRWLIAVPDVGPTCEVLLADRLLADLAPTERDAMLDWVRASQDESGAWLDLSGRPDLSLTALAYWALAQAGDDRNAERMVKAVRVVHALGGAQRANFEVRLWLAMAGQIEWSWLPAIPAELFLLPPGMPLSPGRFSPWARGVLTPYLLIARAPARLHLADASELLLRRDGETLVSPRLTRPGLAGDLLQLFDRTVKLSRKLPRGPLPGWAQQRALQWITCSQQEHGGWFSMRPTLLSLVAMRVMGARSDDPRIRRGLDYLRRARGLALARHGTGAGTTGIAQGLCAAPLSTAAALVAGAPQDADAAWLVRVQLQDPGHWQQRADAPAGGWPVEPGARAHLDLEATCAVLDALAQLRPEDPASTAAWAAARRANDVLLAMQQNDGSFARFERGESSVMMRRLPWTDADLLAYGGAEDGTHVRLTAAALSRLAATGFRADDDRLARGIAYLQRAVTERHDPPDLRTLCALARTAGALLPEEHALRREVERRIRTRQRDDGGFGSVIDTALSLRALLALGHTCVQAQRAARHLIGAVERDHVELSHGTTTTSGGFGLSPETVDPSAPARESLLALRGWAAQTAQVSAQVTELRT
jgi:squalene-hopene/tetraprenyl-beta-curcumene cyclase